MKLLALGRLALIWGTWDEIDKLYKLAAGTHHVHQNTKGGKRPRRAKEEVTQQVEVNWPKPSSVPDPDEAGAEAAAFGGVNGQPEEAP